MPMEWKRLLSDRRIGNYPGSKSRAGNDLRSEFEKDYHRIIGSSSFRRLQDKTQVFALDKSDFIRTRLTHSLEVSSFARSLGQNISEYILKNRMDPGFSPDMKEDVCNILQCAGLIHDIGNPPFGHFGEEAIREWFRSNLSGCLFRGRPVTEWLEGQMLQDLYHFEGNAQALRQVTKLHFLVNEYGMNLTYALLNTIIKYPVGSTGIQSDGRDVRYKKMGYFRAEEAIYRRIAGETGTTGLRHPLTYILEAADDIAYKTADIEDAYKKGFLPYEKLLEELKAAEEKAGNSSAIDPVGMLEHQFENGLRRNVEDPKTYAVQNFLVRLQSNLIFCASFGFTSRYRQIMDGTCSRDLFAGTYGEWIMDALGDIAYRYAFSSRQILMMELSASTILYNLLDRLVHAVLDYDSAEPLKMLDQKMVALISGNYRQIYEIHSRRTDSEAERLYLRLLLVTDFISGMTDSYAKDLYQIINGMV